MNYITGLITIIITITTTTLILVYTGLLEKIFNLKRKYEINIETIIMTAIISFILGFIAGM